MRSHVTTYTCAACGVRSPIEVSGLAEPARRITVSRDPVVRRIHAERVKAGTVLAPREDEEVISAFLAQEARSRLLFATCPRCGERNPEGVALQAREVRRTRVFNTALFAALTLGAWFFPPLALLLPVSDLALWKPLAVWTLKKRGESIPLLAMVRDLALDTALIALVLVVPRAAPAVPALALLQALLLRPDTEGPWRRTRESIKLAEG